MQPDIPHNLTAKPLSLSTSQRRPPSLRDCSAFPSFSTGLAFARDRTWICAALPLVVGWVKHGPLRNGALREPVKNRGTCSQWFDSATMGTWCPNPPFPGRFAPRTLTIYFVRNCADDSKLARGPVRRA